jgi:FkbM family methyltransferase
LKTRLVSGKLGIKYHLVDGDDLISLALRKHGVYEPELLMVTAGVLAALAPMTEDVRCRVLDIGANIGTFVLPLAKVYGSATFECFEPQLPVLELLRRNIEVNQLTNVVTHSVGLSDQAASTVATLPNYNTERNIGAFSLDAEVQANDYEVETRGEQQTIELRTLDSFGYRDVGMLKVDVEGMELSVLRGGEQTLRDNGYPPILFEAWTWKAWYAERRRQLISWVEGLGYRVESFGMFNNLAQHPSRAIFELPEELRQLRREP